MIPFGCEAALFASTDTAPPADDVRLPSPIVGFHGHISGRIDLDMLEAITARGHSLLLVGPRQLNFDEPRLQRLFLRPNVQWMGPRPFDRLPSYLRAMDVGIVPYALDDPFNQSSFPLKTLEYLAAGRPVIATPLPATRWLDTDLIRTASDPDAFADAVERCLTEPQTDDVVARRRAFAARHSWQARAEHLADAIDLPKSHIVGAQT
jgi:teichuronic acid biosynthesis glycosyltransferase TuaH